MLHKKVHPERSVNARESAVLKKGMVANSPNDGCANENSAQLNGENIRFSTKSASKEETQCYKSNMNLPQYKHSNSNFSDKGEHWIKTDADCKYNFNREHAWYIMYQHQHSKIHHLTLTINKRIEYRQ